MAPAAQLTSRDLSAANNVEPMPAPVSGFAQLGKVSLPRTGQRPLVFEGEEIVSATSCAPGPRFWYEINLYRRQDNSLVVNICWFGKPNDLKDRFRAFPVDSLDEVAHVLETYDPALDIHADIPAHDDQVPVSLIALQAAMIRMQIDEARRQFADLAGEILHQLSVRSSRGHFATVAERQIMPCDTASIRRIVSGRQTERCREHQDPPARVHWAPARPVATETARLPTAILERRSESDKAPPTAIRMGPRKINLTQGFQKPRTSQADPPPGKARRSPRTM